MGEALMMAMTTLRKLLVAIFVLFCTPLVMGQMMQQIVVNSGSSATNYKMKMFSWVAPGYTFPAYFSPMAFSHAALAVEQVQPLPLAGNFRKLCVQFYSDPDSGASSNGYTLQLRKNKVDVSGFAITIRSNPDNSRN